MKLSLIFMLLLVVALVVDNGDCWGRRRRRRRRRSGGWGISNGGVTYTFKNGATVTGHGGFKNGGSVGVKVSIPFGRKRRSVEDEIGIKPATPEPEMTLPTTMPITEEPTIENDQDIDSQLESPAVEHERQEKDDNCDECLDIQPFKVNDEKVANETIARNDFVMVVKLIEENISTLKLQAKMKFEVVEVVKSPVENIKQGETFTIDAEMAKCPCLSSLDPGYFVVTGAVNDQDQLVLSSVLMEFEH